MKRFHVFIVVCLVAGLGLLLGCKDMRIAINHPNDHQGSGTYESNAQYFSDEHQLLGEWGISFGSKYACRGTVDIYEQIAPEKYHAKVVVNYVRKGRTCTATQDATVVVKDDGVLVISCYNAQTTSKAGYNPDNFRLTWSGSQYLGKNMDAKGANSANVRMWRVG